MSKPNISYHSPSQCKCFVNTGLGCIQSQLGLSSTCVKQLALTYSGNLLARLSYLSSALPAYIREAKMSQKKQSMWFRTIFKEGFSFFLPPVNWSLTNNRLKQILISCSKPQVFPWLTVWPIKLLMSHIHTTLFHWLSLLKTWWDPPGIHGWYPPITALQLCELSQWVLVTQ